jgi:hypothetical protein
MRACATVVLMLGWLAAGCGDAQHSRAEASSSIADDDPSPGARVCRAISPREVSELLGGRVGEGKVVAPGRSACQWSGGGADDAFYAQVQLLEPRFWVVVRGAEPAEGIDGEGAHSVQVIPGEWAAATLKPDYVITLVVNAPGVTRETAVQLLRIAADRL